MAKEIVTISISKKIKNKGQRASEDMFGRVNFSGYIQVLIDQDCRIRGIK
jgi:hypothetical protein